MSGTKKGGKLAASTNKSKYGDDYYSRIGALGGRNGHTGGFYANRELARTAGSIGGKKSKRRKKENDDSLITEKMPRELMESILSHSDNSNLISLGESMFVMYTQHGFPPDMFLDKISTSIPDLDKSAKIFIVSEYQSKLLEHRRKAGLHDKNMEKIRRTNRIIMERFIKTGELGIY